jgi:hypothetical protein
VGFEPIPLLPGTGTTPGGLPWRPVAAPLAEGIGLSRLVTWSGGFAVIESENEPGGDSVDVALWHSPDGATWVRSPLPVEVTSVWSLVADGDELVLATVGPPWNRKSVNVRLWRSKDAVAWDPAGSFADRLPAGDRRDWDLGARALLVVDDGLVLLTARTRFQSGSGGWSPIGPQLALVDAQALRAARPPERMTAWTTRDGTH